MQKDTRNWEENINYGMLKYEFKTELPEQEIKILTRKQYIDTRNYSRIQTFTLLTDSQSRTQKIDVSYLKWEKSLQ